jgi:hypothetical protein
MIAREDCHAKVKKGLECFWKVPEWMLPEVADFGQHHALDQGHGMAR